MDKHIPPGIFYSPDYECFYDNEHNIMDDLFDEVWMERAAEFPTITFDDLYWEQNWN